jgi:hypothetical protein
MKTLDMTLAIVLVLTPLVLAPGLVGCQRSPEAGGPAREQSALAAAPPARAAHRRAAVGRDCATARDCSWWQDPDPRLACCDGQCSNTAIDAENCGACGNVCGAGQTCVNDACRSAGQSAARAVTATGAMTATVDCGPAGCAPGQLCCGGECIKPERDHRNCGACGVTCKFGVSACRLGVCCPGTDPGASCHTARCPDGQVWCGAACRDVGADADHCGGCDRACPPSARRCVAGACLP